MKLTVHIETTDLGTKAGDCETTIDGPNVVSIKFDPARLVNPNGLRDLIMRELDMALMCIVYGVTPEQVREKIAFFDKNRWPK